MTKADADAILIGIAGVAAVLWVGSFIFLSLPQLRRRYPVAVAAGLSFLQSAFVFALAALVLPTIALRCLAAIWAIYYLAFVPLQRLAQVTWLKITARGKLEAKITEIDGAPTGDVSPTEAQAILSDLIARATSWRLTLQLSVAFIVIAIWPTAYSVSLVSVFLIWQGSRLVRAALLNQFMPKPTPSSEPPARVDVERAFRRFRLGWLLRFGFFKRRVEEYNKSHPSPK